MSEKEIVSHISFPLRVRRVRSHVFVEDADGTPRTTIGFRKNVPFSRAYAEFVCKLVARGLTDLHEGKVPAAATALDPPAPPDELSFAVELWFRNDSGVQQTLARFARLTHAQQFYRAIGTEYEGELLRLRQGIRVISETAKTRND